MEALAQRYPDDDEAQIAYALTLNVAASPGDKTYANQLKGAAILEPISTAPAAASRRRHYLIHLYDYPAIAEKGLDAATRYAKIAPAAPHAQHMPSHIFTRVGYWKESIASNLASARAAKDGQGRDDQLHGHGLHGLCLSAARPGQEGARRHRRDGAIDRLQVPMSPGRYALAASTGALHGRARRLERRRAAARAADRNSPTSER